MSVSTMLQGHRRSGRAAIMRRVAALALTLCCVAPFVVSVPSAGADDVDSLSARADRIAQRLVGLQQQISSLGERFNQSQVRREQIAEQKIDIEHRSAAAKLEVAARRADASRYALSAYVGVDQGDTLALALDGRQWDLNRRNGYAAIRIGDREQVVDDLQAAQQINDDLLASLAQANEAEKKIASDLEAQQTQATRLIDEAEKLQASVKGKLAEAVSRRQAAIAAAQAAQQNAAATPTGTEPTAPNAAESTGSASSTTTSNTTGGSTTPGTTPTTRPANPTSPSTTAPPVVTPPPPVVAPPPVTTGASSSKGQTAANAAISQLGVRYSWGGGTASGPSYGFGPGAGVKGFDCSGLTLYAWAQAGVYLYHSAQMQYDASTHISLSQLRPGDLVFFGSSASTIDHVGIYVGGGQIVHAPNHTTVVQYGPVNLWPGYYAWRGAGRPG